MMDRETVRNT